MNEDEITNTQTTTGATEWTNFHKVRNGTPAQARQALDALVVRYRPLILWYIRKNGINPNKWEDLCHDYLVQEFIDHVVFTADRKKGRFRTFLFHTLNQFITSDWRKEYAQKRGNGRVVSYDEMDPEGELLGSLADRASMQQLEFEIEMALCLHEGVLLQLRETYSSRDQAPTFEALLPHLFEIDSESYASAPDRLKASPEAVRQNLSRLRKRYAEILVERVANESLSVDEDAKTEAKEVLKLIGAGLSRRAGSRPR